MKYICKECGSEYTEKPDFCDCGNDTFEEIVEQVKEIIEEKPIPQKEKIKIETPMPEKKAYKPMEIGEKISWAIFLTCILLSVLVILFFANPKPEDISKDEVKPTKTEQNQANMPAIDNVWDNTIQVQELSQKKKIENKAEQIAQQIPQPITKPVQPTKKVLNKVNKTNAQKPSKTPVTKATSSSTTPQVQKPAPATQTISATVKQATEPTPAEIRNYKEALRRKIVAHIDFMNIIGDGYCEVTFSVTPTGKITYPTGNVFTVKSENPSLNDAVFSAMRTVTNFNAPPQGKALNYMHLRVSLYGNEFSVYLN